MRYYHVPGMMMPFVLGIFVVARVPQNMLLCDIQNFLDSLFTYC